MSSTFFKVFWLSQSSRRQQQLFKVTTLQGVCQVLFWISSKISLFRPRPGASAPTALLEYQITSRLSSAFHKVFQVFCRGLIIGITNPYAHRIWNPPLAETCAKDILYIVCATGRCLFAKAKLPNAFALGSSSGGDTRIWIRPGFTLYALRSYVRACFHRISAQFCID